MMVIITRRQFISSAPAILGGSSVLAACSQSPDPDGYEAVAAQTWRRENLLGLEGAALSHELVRYATLAPSSHNTQCWKFAVDGKAITLLPDMSRRCPAVDPDDHHVFVSLGCA
ncbi:MAG: Tat pathway signal protein, partial [Rubrivivax sp.]|nr:Tat pathway signal protein [Rubrivivax sp.]